VFGPIVTIVLHFNLKGETRRRFKRDWALGGGLVLLYYLYHFFSKSADQLPLVLALVTGPAFIAALALQITDFVSQERVRRATRTD
jgi:hypothetical protein